MSGKSALILGSTGQTGRHVLENLLASSHFSRVGEYGRRVTPADQLTTGKEKLEQKTIDFDKIEESGLKDGKWDVVYITLGTTRKAAGSAEAFEKIDREYVLRAAKEAKDPESTTQRLVYCSSGGADSSSSFLYMRSKGLTEEGLASLGYSDTIIFRPGYLAGTSRGESRIAESILGKAMGVFAHFTNSLQIDVRPLGRSLYLAGIFGSENLPAAGIKIGKEGNPEHPFTVLNNPAALKLAEAKE